MSKPEQKPELPDLESPIMDAVRMASIHARLVTDALAKPNDGNSYHLTDTQVEDILFSAYHTQEMIKKFLTDWENIL